MHEIHRIFTKFSQDIESGINSKAVREINKLRLESGGVLEFATDIQTSWNTISHIKDEIKDLIEKEVNSFEERAQAVLMEAITRVYERERTNPSLHENLEERDIIPTYSVSIDPDDVPVVRQSLGIGETVKDRKEYPIKSISQLWRSHGMMTIHFEVDGELKSIRGSMAEDVYDMLESRVPVQEFLVKSR